MDNDTEGDVITCFLCLAWLCTIFISVKLFIGITVGIVVVTVALLLLLEWPVMFLFLCFLLGILFWYVRELI